MTEREQKIVNFYAHDYRDMKQSENDIKDLLEGFLETINCNHVCQNTCRFSGCNCDCGEYHQ